MQVKIVEFASWLDENYESLDLSNQLSNLCEIIHREGINIRYLGLIRLHCKKPTIKKYIFVEMISRIVKNILRSRMRLSMKSSNGIQRRTELHSIVIDMFNIVVGSHADSAYFWFETLRERIIEHFGDVLEDEKGSSFNIMEYVDMNELFFSMNFFECL